MNLIELFIYMETILTELLFKTLKSNVLVIIPMVNIITLPLIVVFTMPLTFRIIVTVFYHRDFFRYKNVTFE